MILNKLRGLTWSFLGAAAFATCSASAQTGSQPIPQIAKPVDVSVRHIIANSVPAQVRSASDLGRASASLPMKDMLLRLKSSVAQVAALNKFVADVQNPSSPNYHHWISPTEFGSRFGVSDADAKTVANWLTSSGFTVTQIANGKGWIRFSGTSSQVENAFATEIHSYSAAGAKQYSNAKPISIPDALSPAVAGLLSVNSFTKRPLHSPVAEIKRGSTGKMLRTTLAPAVATANALASITGDKNGVHPNFTSQEAPEETFLTPGDFSRIYNTKPLISAGTDGTGVSIAIVGRSDISLSDVEAFRTVFGLPYNDPNFILASGDPGVIPGDDEEAILDVEWSGAVAPNAKINYVIGASTYSTDGVDISASYIVDNVVSPIMTVSFGSCEQAQSQSEIDFFHDLWEQASAEGISVFVSSGDSGSSSCDIPNEYIATPYDLGVSALASTPFNTAVGGTEFADSDTNTYWNLSLNSDLSSVKGYIPETVWNESCNPYLPVSATNCFFDPDAEGTYAGGGGASSCSVHPEDDTPSRLTGLFDCQSGYPKPSWQSGPGVPQDGARDLPDVSLAAAGIHDGYMICYDGSCQWTTNPDGSISLTSASIIGGTSAASPSMAGIMALVEQKNGQYQGLANYQLYKLASLQATGSCDSSTEIDPTQVSSCVFNDITAGGNALSCDFGAPDCTTQVGNDGFGLLSGWSATPGYDLASGLGSVNAANLVSAWSSNSLVATTATLSVSSTTFAHGTPVNVTSVVSPSTGSGTPSGDIVLKAAGAGTVSSPDITGTLASGQYAASLTSLPGGTYNLTAQYAGDATYATSVSAPVSLTVTPENSVMTAGTLAPSRFFILGKRPIVAATATSLSTNWFISIGIAGNSGGGTPTGSISINDGAKTIGTYPLDHTGSIYIVCGPYTECDYPVGTVNFTATYTGDSSFNKSTATFPFTINQGSIDFIVSLSSRTPPAGSTVIAQVTFDYDPAVLPTGTVSLYRDDTGALITTGTIGSDGVANIPFIAAAGDYFVTGQWPGDNNYKAGKLFGYSELITSAGGAITTTSTLAVNSTTSVIGGRTQAVIVVKPATTTASATIPSGTVTLHTTDGLQAAPVTLVGGQATTFLSWADGNVGVEKIYATYDGDANFNGSSTAVASITINKVTPSLQLSALSGYVAAGGQTSVSTALISTPANFAAAVPTGTVQFFDSVGGAAAIALGTPQPINGGNRGSFIATLAPILATGTHIITAVYSGDVNWNSATAAAVTIIATTPDFSVLATPDPLTVVAGQSAAVSVSSQSVLGFTGPVALSCGTLPVGLTCNTATVAAGASGTITLSSTAPGTVAHAENRMTPALGATGVATVAAMLMLFIPKRRYRLQLLLVLLAAGIATSLSGCGGNGSPRSTSVALTSSSTKVASGSAVTLEATISSTDSLTGTVTFSDNGTTIGSPATVNGGVATLSTSTLSVGTHSITATYSGDSKNLSSQSADTLNQTITGMFNLTLNATSGTLSHALTVPATLQ